MSDEQMIMALRKSGFRVTKQRALVAEVIAKNDGASCKDIICLVRSRDKSIGTATVYRMIKALEDIGAVERVDMIKMVTDNR
ncbi:Fur family transcriptional regulator [Butyrivibrio sp. NC3005]|uniref:Fur family transcriptional regulator n=1 Tax=Butyrivibrio sp. NC3005 TaxID=1280685 RepID=UPI00041CB03E|nr:transcriptional repressor [Butyrivibrio sp. NC3005]